MNLPIASESAMNEEYQWEFVPVIRVKAGLAVRRNPPSGSPALPSGLLELGPWEDHARAASRQARPVKINLLFGQIQQQNLAP
jgi:hypothetical protein